MATSPSSLTVRRLPYLSQTATHARAPTGHGGGTRERACVQRLTWFLQHEQRRRPRDRSAVHPPVVRQRVLGAVDEEIHQPDRLAVRLHGKTEHASYARDEAANSSSSSAHLGDLALGLSHAAPLRNRHTERRPVQRGHFQRDRSDVGTTVLAYLDCSSCSALASAGRLALLLGRRTGVAPPPPQPAGPRLRPPTRRVPPP